MKQILQEMTLDVNKKLDIFLPKAKGRLSYIYESMRYSIFAGGKRIRPILLLLAYEAIGGKDTSVYPFACAVEMIHTYSLIHDDLPPMDDDDLRRGIATNHIKYGQWAAILAGDGLLNLAFEIMLEETMKNPRQPCIEAMQILSAASGTRGMIGGQVIDIMSEDKEVDEETIRFIYENKTAALIAASVDMGAALGNASDDVKRALHQFALNLGVAFQIEDDILDLVSTKEELGKPIHSDIKNNKSTYVSIVGVEAAKREIEMLTQEGIKELEILGERAEKLKQLALILTSRTY